MSANGYPSQENKKPRGRLAAGLGKLVTNKEAEAVGVDWRAVANHAKKVPVSNSALGETGGQIFQFGPRKTSVATQAGRIRDLRALLFVGNARLGLVLESDPKNEKPDKFLLTELGEGQKSGLTLREAALNDASELKIGRASGNDVVFMEDQTVSRAHGTILITPVGLRVDDNHSSNGITYLTANSAHESGADPMLAAAWDEMQAKPELWSGEFMGGTVVRAQS